MNRNQQTHMGPSDACYYADHGGCPFPTMCECSCHKSLAGDSTPPATPVESPLLTDVLPPWRATLMETRACAASWEPGVRLLGNVRAGDIVAALDHVLSHPPAVSGEGERLKEQAAAYRAIALDALARWQGEDDHSDDNQRRNRSARSRATLRHRICAVDDTVRASTPTPGAPR